MPAEGRHIAFRPVATADLPLLGRWMQGPHWRQWWGEPAVELGYIVDMLAGRDTTRPFIFETDGTPAGYIEMWRIDEARLEPWLSDAPWLMWLPDDAVGVDLSIGEEACLGKGLGSAALARFVAMLRAEGHHTIVIDPDPANGRAIGACRRAGFRPIPQLTTRTHDVLLMQHHEEPRP